MGQPGQPRRVPGVAARWFRGFRPAPRASNSTERADWIPSLGAHYAIGIDGISLLLVMLTTLMGFIATLCSWSSIDDRVKEYYAMFLLLQTGMIGVFISLDFFLFYVFWELVLVPMYFIIGIWGGPRKLYAAIKFFLYTLAGSVLMLLGILALYFAHYEQFHFYTFEIAELMKVHLPHGLAFRLAGVGLLAVLPGLRHQGAHVPVPYLAPRRPRGSAHGGLGDSGRGTAEDGDVRIPAILAAAAAASFIGPDDRADSGGAFHYRHHLWRAGEPDAAGLEEADRVFVGEPPGVLHAWVFSR